MFFATNVSSWLRTNMKLYFRIENAMLKHQTDRLKSRHKSPTDVIHCLIRYLSLRPTFIIRLMRGKETQFGWINLVFMPFL